MTAAETGRLAEELAAQRLQAKGYELLCRNYHAPTGEVDIIARDGACIVFVEVRARTKGSMVSPFESIDARKRRKIISAAYHYLEAAAETISGSLQPRFDAVAVTVEKNIPPQHWPWEHLAGAFDGSAYYANY